MRRTLLPIGWECGRGLGEHGGVTGCLSIPVKEWGRVKPKDGKALPKAKS
jgi:hypothetical protein